LTDLKRSDTVIDLLRNIPHFGYPESDLINAPVPMANTSATDYRRGDKQKKKEKEKKNKRIREGDIEGVAAPRTCREP